MDLAAIGLDLALAEERVVGGHGLHLVHHLHAVMGVGAHGVEGLQVMGDGGVDARLHHGGLVLVFHAVREALGEGAGAVVQIPVEGFRELQPLRHLQAQRMHVREEEQQRRQLLPAAGDAEFRGLLDGVGRVAACIGQTNDLGLGGLRLQQEGREVRAVEGMAHGAQDLAAIGGHDRRGVALQRLAEGVIGGQEEPGVAAALHHRLARAIGEQIGVIGPVDRVGRAGRICEIGGRRARVHVDDVLLLGDAVHRQRHAGGQHAHDSVDLLLIGPLAGEVHAHVRLVLMVGGDHVDLPALRRQP